MPPGDIYKNASLTNFVHPESQEKMRAALRDVRARFGQKYPLVIDGKEVWTDKLLPSLNPSAPDQIVGLVAEAGIPEAERAVKAARRAFQTWGRTPFEERCQLLERVAAILDRRRFELSAVEVFEVGKPWAEADGQPSSESGREPRFRWLTDHRALARGHMLAHSLPHALES
jgi:1-pyrroline-5-carboxylate dehydrogenase